MSVAVRGLDGADQRQAAGQRRSERGGGVTLAQWLRVMKQARNGVEMVGNEGFRG